MNIAYDPVAKELMVDLENGSPPIGIAIPEIQFKVWADGATLSCLVRDGDIEFGVFPIEGAHLQLLPRGPNRYQVTFTHSPESSPLTPLADDAGGGRLKGVQPMEKQETVYRLVTAKLVVEDELAPRLHLDTQEAWLSVAKSLLKERDRTQVLAMHLDAGNVLISAEITSVGGPSGFYISPAALFRSALLAGATGVVFVYYTPGHTRPVQTVEPALPAYVLKAARSLGLRVVDQLAIIGHASMSLRDFFPDLPWDTSPREGLVFDLLDLLN